MADQMDEKKAREIVKRWEELDGAVTHCDAETYATARGFLSGLEAGREGMRSELTPCWKCRQVLALYEKDLKEQAEQLEALVEAAKRARLVIDRGVEFFGFAGNDVVIELDKALASINRGKAS